MTYKIIGGDGKEYGPVSDADLRKWVAEGRVSAQTLAKSESDTEFRALETFPEFADFFGITSPAADAPAPAVQTIDWNRRDYELDIGGCFSGGWSLFMDNIGLLLGCTALYLLIFFIGSGVLNAILGGVLSQMVPDSVQYSAAYMILQNIVLQGISALFLGPVTGGYYYVFIQTLRGEPTSVGDMFSGFSKAYTRLFTGWFIYQLAVIICWIPFNIVFSARAAPVLVHMKHMTNPREMHGLWQDLLSALSGTFPIMLLCLIPSFYLVTSLVFIFPLIIDQGMDVGTAIGTSFKMVHKHWFTVFGLVLLTVIIYFAGFILCCLPALFTVGIATSATVFAYQTIFCGPSQVRRKN